MILARRSALIALPLLAGCSVFPDRPYIEVLRYPLQPVRTTLRAPARAPRRTLLVRLLRSAPGTELRGLRTIRADGTERLDPYAEWAAPPAELIEEAARRWLAGAGLFAGVVAPGTRARPDLVLECEVTALEADLRTGQARAGLSAVLLAESPSGGDGRLLGQWAVSGEAPLAASTSPDGPPPGAVASACTEALGAALTALENAIAPYA